MALCFCLLDCVGVLGSPLTHIRLSMSAILVRLHHGVVSSGTRCSSCKSVVLVTLGSYHLLDGLVACDSIEACEKIVRCSGGGFVRGIVLTPWGS